MRHMSPKSSKRTFVKKTVNVFVFAALGFMAASGFALIKSYESNVNSVNVTAYLPEKKEAATQEEVLNEADPYPVDATPSGDLNYVIIGSDTRAGDNGDISGDNNLGGWRSDVTMLVHVSADKRNVDVVSIPRDTIVDIPECLMSDGSSTSASPNTQFNAAFSKGDILETSIACTINTIQTNTGVEVDGFAVVDFVSFINVVDGLGGVEIDVPEDMVSKKAGLDIEEGTQTLDGETALAYARARTFEVGSSIGSDLERIERQQQLLTALSDEILNTGTLTDPKKIYSLVGNVASSLTVSDNLDTVREIVSLLYGARNLEGVNFYTTPTQPWPQDRNRLVWTDEVETYWEAIKNDTPIVPISE